MGQETHAARMGQDHTALLAKQQRMPQELFRKAGRYHSRLQNIEEECWVYKGSLPGTQPGRRGSVRYSDVYFWRTAFHPLTLDEVPD